MSQVVEDKLVRTGFNGVDDKPNNEGADKPNTEVKEDTSKGNIPNKEDRRESLEFLGRLADC